MFGLFIFNMILVYYVVLDYFNCIYDCNLIDDMYLFVQMLSIMLVISDLFLQVCFLIEYEFDGYCYFNVDSSCQGIFSGNVDFSVYVFLQECIGVDFILYDGIFNGQLVCMVIVCMCVMNDLQDQLVVMVVESMVE